LKKVIKNIFIILSSSEKQKLWLLTLADIFISILDIIFLLTLLYVINFYTQPAHAVFIKGFSLAVFNAHPVLLITVFFLLFAVKNAAGFIVSKKQYYFVYNVASRISGELVTQYLDGSYEDYVNVDSSIINRKISQEPIEFCQYVLNGVQQVFSQFVLVGITLIAIFILNPLLFPLLVLILTPPVFLIVFLMKRKLDSARLHGKKTGERSMQYLQEALSGYVDSNIYKKNTFFISRYHRFQVQLNHYLADRQVIQNMPPRLIEVFAVFGLLILVMVNFVAAHSDSIQLVTIGALMVAAYKIIPGIVKITNASGQVKTYAFAAEDLAAAAHAPLKNNYHNEPVHAIAFENVFFEYPEKKILASFSLKMQKGDFMVVSGISGKGKTTFVHLLLGFLTPSSGTIYFNDRPASTKARQHYWGKIAYVKQQGFFLHASIIENIALQEAGYDEAKIKKITAITGVDKLANSFPQGLKTMVTENGKNFSGGQRQRIIFARALYKDFDLLILDEPFNELDEPSEMHLLRELQKMAADGKMILLITHNREAMSFGNKKIVMDEQG
jgi:ABC-type bacteriocin/lantibiotic exporter with double-glycine peptidase domain